VPKLKAALDIKNLKKELRDDLEASVAYKAGIVGKGVAGSRTTEPIPRLSQANCENIMESGTNASIVIGKDRPGSKLSGYGGRGDAGAGTVDIVAGRMSHNPAEVNAKNELIQANPDFKIDASRIYISQKTDVDDNFDLAEGKIGNSKARSAIAIKSDAIRLIAREGIKLVTGTDIKNSTGENIISVSGIDLIAGNDDEILQPLVLGTNLNDSLNKLTDFVDKLSGIVSGAITYQMKFNTKVMTHTHITAFFGTPTAPSEALIPAGIEVMKNHGTKTIAGIVKFRTNLKFHKQTYYAVSGAKYINSSFNNTN
tara:strand:+ start:1020 stop:1955 length:936 start_codon:yes stop_codon:yes gene_type:complete